MVSEEIVIDRAQVECIVRDLCDLLKIESHFQFKLRFSKKDNGRQTLTIVPYSWPVEITLSRS
jgi:hypothetical protein